MIWQLLGEGTLKVEQRIAELLPEFAENGKDEITLEQVLLHTSGFPRAPLGPPQWDTHEGRHAAFARWKLNWEPGTRYEYHPTSAHWVLGEVIHAVTGEDHGDAVHRRVAEPLGLHGFRLGGAPDDFSRRAAGPAARRAAHLRGDHGGARDPGDPTRRGDRRGARAARHARGRARSACLVGARTATAADVVLFYQALLDDRQGLWDPAVLDDVTSTVRNTMKDPIFRVPANRSRGLIIAGDDGSSHLRGLGRTVSPRTFGHNGAAGQLAWADPDSGISFCYLTNGNDQHLFRQYRRGTALSSLAAVCAEPAG